MPIAPQVGRRAVAATRAWLRGWPAVAHVLASGALAVPYLAAVTVACVGIVTLPVVVGAVLLAPCLPGLRWLGDVERIRLYSCTGAWLPGRPRVQRASHWSTLLLDLRPWTSAVYLVFASAWGALGALALGLGLTAVLAGVTVAVPALVPALAGDLPLRWHTVLGPVGAPASGAALIAAALIALPWLSRALVAVQLRVAGVLLSEAFGARLGELTRRVETLAATRERAVDAIEDERRRIERDLHDGPQQRLVSIALQLGVARRQLATAPEQAARLLDAAHDSAKASIVEMRQVARGIHPPILTDRGLAAAVSSLVAPLPLPVAVDVELPVRPAATVEAIAYFCISEGLTNVVKHARASKARVTAAADGGRLVVTVWDDGVGGARPGAGTGLIGLAGRAEAVDGTLAVDSPAGGPTELRIDLPLSPDTASREEA